MKELAIIRGDKKYKYVGNLDQREIDMVWAGIRELLKPSPFAGSEFFEGVEYAQTLVQSLLGAPTTFAKSMVWLAELADTKVEGGTGFNTFTQVLGKIVYPLVEEIKEEPSGEIKTKEDAVLIMISKLVPLLKKVEEVGWTEWQSRRNLGLSDASTIQGGVGQLIISMSKTCTLLLTEVDPKVAVPQCKEIAGALSLLLAGMRYDDFVRGVVSEVFEVFKMGVLLVNAGDGEKTNG